MSPSLGRHSVFPLPDEPTGNAYALFGADKVLRSWKTPSSAWRPGQSGTPGNRPKVSAEIRNLACEHGPKAFEPLVALMHSQNASVAARAAEALLDRGYGRPTQGMELSDEASPKHTVIRVVFVTPPKREAPYSVSQRPSVIGLPEPK